MDWTKLKAKYGKRLLAVATALAAALLGALAQWLGTPTPEPVTVEKVVHVEKTVVKEVPAAQDGVEVVAGQGPPETRYFGWTPPTVEEIIAHLDPLRTLQFDATPAGKVAMGDDDAFLWRAVRKVNNKAPPWYPNIDQGPVGCCVGAGYKHSGDVCQATQIAAGRNAEWKPLSAEVIYGLSRVDIGGGRLSGDGSTGGWASKAIREIGVAPMQPYSSGDLTTFSASRAREFGRRGVPDDVKAFAKRFPVKGTALVKSSADAKRSIQQGYPIAVCSSIGFEGMRDASGLIRANGTWYHCMAIIGVATKDGKIRFFILNSWSDSAHKGGVWPEDMPIAGFWAEESAVDRMMKQADSFALSDAVGFPSRKLDWNVNRIEPLKDLFTLRRSARQIGAPEAVLSW